MRDSHRKNSIKREIEILKLMNHPNIISFISIIDTNKEMHLVTSYGGGISLRQYLK